MFTITHNEVKVPMHIASTINNLSDKGVCIPQECDTYHLHNQLSVVLERVSIVSLFLLIHFSSSHTNSRGLI